MAIRTILHAADVHLDSPLQKLDTYDNAPSQRIRRATRVALENMTRLAIDRDVDLVVIAGDLYDGDWTEQNTGLAFVGEAVKLTDAGIPLLVIRGNHDAADLMTSALPLPKNPDGSDIFLQTGKPESRFLEDLGIAVHGQSFRSRAEKSNLAAKYPAAAKGMFNLGLLHTGLEGDHQHAHYAPCTPRQLTDHGYDYWALGHIHTRHDHALEGGPPIVFSGNIQGRHIREQGAKGCVLIEIDDRNDCTYQFEPLDVLRWELCEIDATQMEHRDEIMDQFETWLSSNIDECDGRLLIPRVRVHGQSTLHTTLHQSHAALRADLQAISVATGFDQVWLEDVRIRTAMPARQSFPIDFEGPLESLNAVLHDLRTDTSVADTIQSQISGLQKKLPRELKRDDEEATFPLEDQEWLNELIESAAADVLGRINGSTESSANNSNGRETSA